MKQLSLEMNKEILIFSKKNIKDLRKCGQQYRYVPVTNIEKKNSKVTFGQGCGLLIYKNAVVTIWLEMLL